MTIPSRIGLAGSTWCERWQLKISIGLPKRISRLLTDFDWPGKPSYRRPGRPGTESQLEGETGGTLPDGNSPNPGSWNHRERLFHPWVRRIGSGDFRCSLEIHPGNR